MRDLFGLLGDSVDPNVFGYELAYAQGRDPFPEGEATLYLDRLGPYLAQVAPPPATVLDIGGGTGRIAIPLATAGYEVTILEPAAAGMAIAHRKAEAAGVASRLSYVCGDARDAPHLAPASFDVVLGIQSLLYLDDLRPALERVLPLARRALCFDVPSLYGFLLSRMPGFGITLEHIQWLLEHGTTPGDETLRRERFRCYRVEELADLAGSAGLEVDEIVPVSFLEVLGWSGEPAAAPERRLEEQFREDRLLRQLAAFHLVLARPPSA